MCSCIIKFLIVFSESPFRSISSWQNKLKSMVAGNDVCVLYPGKVAVYLRDRKSVV